MSEFEDKEARKAGYAIAVLVIAGMLMLLRGCGVIQ